MTAKQPPIALQVPFEHVYHGERIGDPWHWLRDKSDPRVTAYLQAENAYTRAWQDRVAGLHKRIYDEFIGRLQEDDAEVPWRKGPWLYYSRTAAKKSYSIHCRKPIGSDGKPGAEVVILDKNALAAGHKHLGLGGLEVSPNHALLAYSVDTDGGERFEVRVRDLATGKDLADRIPGADYGLEWGNDNKTLLYTVADKTHRPHEVRRHVLGTPHTADAVLYREDDERFHVWLSKTRSERFIVAQSESAVTSEVRVLDADRPNGTLRLLAKRRQGVEYGVTHHGEHFWIRTNDGAVDFKLVRTKVDAAGADRWETIIGARSGVLLEGASAFAGHLVVRERQGGQPRVVIHTLAAQGPNKGKLGPPQLLSIDEPIYAVSLLDNRAFDTTTLRIQMQSPRTPRTVIDVDMNTLSRTVRKVQPVRGGHDPQRYTTARLWATSHDGAKVPISLVHRADLDRSKTHPCLIVAYAAYGYSYPAGFDRERLALLERGFVVAIAHARGGSELGRAWKDSGKLEHKRNTFMDVIAAAEHLISTGWTSKAQLALRGGSAGGLLVGATINLRPDLFAAALALVPFVDVLNTMMDAALPLTVIEYEEWGNPNERKYFDAMRGYSPYDNVPKGRYPDLFVTAGLNDPRVHYWEPAKWVARVRATAQSRLVLLKTKMGAGHGGASGRYEQLSDEALEFAFMIERLKASHTALKERKTRLDGSLKAHDGTTESTFGGKR